MRFNYNPQSEAMLLKAAPWADLDAIRTKLVERCKTQYDSDYDGDIEDYENNIVPTMPSVYGFRIELNKIINNMYPSHREEDIQFYQARECISHFFFNSDLWSRNE